jgi:hypothetical protein
MKLNCKLTVIFVTLLGMFLAVACGGSKSASLADIPKYPDATELKVGESKLANTLKDNVETDSALRKSMGPLAAKGKVDQKGFSLPGKTKWGDIKSFYEKELKSLGWKSGLGGVAGKFVDINQAMNVGNNELSKTILFSKGNQTLTIIMVTSPKKHLLLSLSSN